MGLLDGLGGIVTGVVGTVLPGLFPVQTDTPPSTGTSVTVGAGPYSGLKGRVTKVTMNAAGNRMEYMEVTLDSNPAFPLRLWGPCIAIVVNS